MSQRTRQIQLQASWETSNKNQQTGVITVSDEWYTGNKQRGKLEGLEEVSWIRQLGKASHWPETSRMRWSLQEKRILGQENTNSKVLET